MKSELGRGVAAPAEVEADIAWRFRCRRSGRCCQVKGGVAWVSDEEQAALATHMNVELSPFRAAHVRELTDPATGRRREALRDRADGACALLDGHNECSVYEARPALCRSFPFWDSITGDPRGFERARQVCPGIEAVPGSDLSNRAVAALEEFFAELPVAPGDSQGSCPHSDRGASARVTGLEVERIARAAADHGNTTQNNACPLAHGEMCLSPSAKPIACRTEQAMERARDQLRTLKTRLGYPQTMGTIPAQLAQRDSRDSLPLHAIVT